MVQVEELGSTTSSPLIAIGASGRIWKVRLKDNPAVLCVLKSFSLVLKVKLVAPSLNQAPGFFSISGDLALRTRILAWGPSARLISFCACSHRSLMLLQVAPRSTNSKTLKSMCARPMGTRYQIATLPLPRPIKAWCIALSLRPKRTPHEFPA